MLSHSINKRLYWGGGSTCIQVYGTLGQVPCPFVTNGCLVLGSGLTVNFDVSVNLVLGFGDGEFSFSLWHGSLGLQWGHLQNVYA